jgi:ribosomal protein S18 acetylase RimI-like enzyme
MKKMEDYFKSIGCEYVVIDVFAYNNLAINFYNKQGYHTRGLIDIKKL